jgi:predicted deacylase
MSIRTTFPLLLAATLAAQDVDPGTSYWFRIDQPTAGQTLLLHQHFDVLGACCGALQPGAPLDVIVQPEELAVFQRIAPAAKLVRRGQPFAQTLAAQVASGGDVPDPNYYTVAEITAEIDAKVAAFPALAQKVDVSALPGGVRTHENRQIFALKVSDNVATDEDEPVIVLAAQIHARELNTPVMVLGAMDRVLNGYATDPALQALVDGYEIWFVPMMNPDGVNHVWTVDDFWRKNRRNNGSNFGVDLNRNFPFLWTLCGGSTTTSSETYRGPSAGSEPEAQAMRNLIARLRPELYIDFHSYGRDVLNLYAPCATVSAAMQTFNTRYVDDLRTPMMFDFRPPSASGEAPHDHWATGGTLSYLIEVGTAFQPVYSATVTEEARVWPGVRRAITAWKPAVRGHVRSSFQLQPLEATITYTPSQFVHGEVTKSRALNGRYGLWLPLGTWQVTYAAAGHQSQTRSITVTGYDAPQTHEVVLDPVWPAATMAKQGTERIGTVVNLTYTSPGDAGAVAFVAWSMSTTPGIQVGGGRVIPMVHDFLFDAALNGNPILAPTWLLLDANAQAFSALTIPNEPWVVGLGSYVNGITWDANYHQTLKKWSQPVHIVPLP